MTPITAAEIAAQKIAYKKRKRLYYEAQAIKIALRNQVIEAINAEYIEPLSNDTPDMINDNIPVISTFFRANYEHIIPGHLKEIDSVINDLCYDPSTNVDTMFNKIQHFQDMCIITGNSRNDTKLVTYAYLIFQNTGIFMQSLID